MRARVDRALGILAVVLLAFGWGAVSAHEAQAQQQQRKLTLELSEVLDTLADFQVVYDSSEEFCSQFAGLTEPWPKKITLCGRMDLGYRRSTLIHEMLHAASWRRSLNLGSEDDVRPSTERIYRELYGK